MAAENKPVIGQEGRTSGSFPSRDLPECCRMHEEMIRYLKDEKYMMERLSRQEATLEKILKEQEVMVENTRRVHQEILALRKELEDKNLCFLKKLEAPCNRTQNQEGEELPKRISQQELATSQNSVPNVDDLSAGLSAVKISAGNSLSVNPASPAPEKQMEKGCSCRGDCANKKCSCTKANKACTENCGCKDTGKCENPVSKAQREKQHCFCKGACANKQCSCNRANKACTGNCFCKSTKKCKNPFSEDQRMETNHDSSITGVVSAVARTTDGAAAAAAVCTASAQMGQRPRKT